MTPRTIWTAAAAAVPVTVWFTPFDLFAALVAAGVGYSAPKVWKSRSTDITKY